jgi:Ca2+-binding EF-hand superfamily protein
MRRLFGNLRLKLKNIFCLLDNGGKGYFTDDEMLDYLQNNRLLSNIKGADLLFIRLDKNRNGRIDFKEVGDEMHALY